MPGHHRAGPGAFRHQNGAQARAPGIQYLHHGARGNGPDDDDQAPPRAPRQERPHTFRHLLHEQFQESEHAPDDRARSGKGERALRRHESPDRGASFEDLVRVPERLLQGSPEEAHRRVSGEAEGHRFEIREGYRERGIHDGPHAGRSHHEARAPARRRRQSGQLPAAPEARRGREDAEGEYQEVRGVRGEALREDAGRLFAGEGSRARGEQAPRAARLRHGEPRHPRSHPGNRAEIRERSALERARRGRGSAHAEARSLPPLR